MREFFDNLWARAQEFGAAAGEWLILLVIALIVLLIGRWIARAISKWLGRLLDVQPLQPIWDKSGVSTALRGGEQTPGSIAATVTYAYLMVVLLLVVTRILRMATIEDLLERLLSWIPALLLAAVVVIIASAAGNWAAGLVRPFANDRGVPWLTYVVHVSVVIFGVLFAMELMNISFAEDVVKILLGATAVALAISFGVGGIDTAKKWWEKYASPRGGSSGPSGPQSH
jgi:hypothetical protein